MKRKKREPFDIINIIILLAVVTLYPFCVSSSHPAAPLKADGEFLPADQGAASILLYRSIL